MGLQVTLILSFILQIFLESMSGSQQHQRAGLTLCHPPLVPPQTGTWTDLLYLEHPLVHQTTITEQIINDQNCSLSFLLC